MKTKPQIGDKIQFNKGVAFAFVGLKGIIESIKLSCFTTKRHVKFLYVVRLDTPTAPANNWSLVETLAVGEEDMILLS